MGEEDWFERALQDKSDASDDDPPNVGDDGSSDTESDRQSNAETMDDTTSDDRDSASTGTGDGRSLFEESFGDALENVNVPTLDDDGPAGYEELEFGLEGTDGVGTHFDDNIDTDLPRIDLGIDGLDRMIHGGVPERSLMVVFGGAGTGKTTFGLQFLNHGLEQGERGVFITLEESRERVINSATEKGIPYDEYVDDGLLAVVDVDPIEMANSLTSIRNELPVLIEEFGATRLVLDSVSLLEMMYEDRAVRRNEIYDFSRSLKAAGVTSLLTSEASDRNPYASRFGIVEYLTDAVFVLQYVRPDDFRETRLAIEIQKIRDANHSREKKPYEITDEGISVHQQANLF